MENLSSLLNKIKKQTVFYLGKPSIYNIRAFFMGYYCARKEFSISQTEKENELAEFRKWLEQQYEDGKSCLLESRILFYSQDERDALNEFFEMYEEFKKYKNPSEKQDNSQ
jgi:hypothetical protein